MQRPVSSGSTARQQAMTAGRMQISRIFRENLKVGTPWVVKTVNIDFLLDYTLNQGMKSQIFHLAAHFSNLIKVSERVTVRHKAGRGLLRIAQALPMEQINEIVIELTKGLEIGEYQFSKYIPEYLGELALYLEPGELDEFMGTLQELIESTQRSDRFGSPGYGGGNAPQVFQIPYETAGAGGGDMNARKQTMLGMLLKGLANYHEVVRQEAFLVIGQYIFGGDELTQEERFAVFRMVYKKMLTLVREGKGFDMNFLHQCSGVKPYLPFYFRISFPEGIHGSSGKPESGLFPGDFRSVLSQPQGDRAGDPGCGI